MKYRVEITDAAFEAIRAQAKYIAVDCRAPLNAARWLEKGWDAIDSLEVNPKRHCLVPENDFKPYEIRRVLVVNCLVLYTIDEDAGTVWVIGFRHGSQLPRPDELPETLPGQGT
jgi:plasmid stabilization system protein ParE